MPIMYYKLFDLLQRKGMKKTSLLENTLECQPSDIMEYIPKQKVGETD